MSDSNSKIYVTMTDKFMSGWGPAKDKTNKLIFVCNSEGEAAVVYNNAINRSDMKFVKICSNPPKYYRKTFGNNYKFNHYYVQIKTKEIYPSWYEEGFFTGNK